MDISLIPENQKWSSKHHREFILNSNIATIVNRYNTSYRLHKSNPNMHYCISYTKSLLLHLQSLGFLVCIIDNSGWMMFKLSNNYDSLMDDISNKDIPHVKHAVVDNQTLTIKESRMIDFTPEIAKSLEFKLKCSIKMKEIIKRCISSKLKFDLELSDIEELLSANQCYYTNKKFDEFNLLSIDRVNSKKGYVKGNVVACISEINSVKSSLLESDNPTFKSIYELKSFVDKIYAHLDDDPLKDLLIK